MENSELWLMFITCVLVPSVPILIGTVQKAKSLNTHVTKIWEKIDGLEKGKAEENKVNSIDDRLRNMEINFAEKMGRFASGLERLEAIEKRIEKILIKMNPEE